MRESVSMPFTCTYTLQRLSVSPYLRRYHNHWQRAYKSARRGAGGACNRKGWLGGTASASLQFLYTHKKKKKIFDTPLVVTALADFVVFSLFEPFFNKPSVDSQRSSRALLSLSPSFCALFLDYRALPRFFFFLALFVP